MADLEKVVRGLECLAQKREPTANPCKDCGYSDRPNYAICVKDIASDALAMFEERETTFEKDGHHIRCTSCGNYWCDTDSEGNLFPHNYCPHCGKAGKLDENRRMGK